MKAEYEMKNNEIVVRLHGELDEFAAGQIKREIDAKIDSCPARTFVFDMGDVGFVDSTGLGFLLGRYKKLRAKHAELVVANVNRQVDKVFKASGVYSFVPKIN